MADRKQRILAKAQDLLDEAGVDGFTMRELSRRANVALRTLYNVFGSKEDIIVSIIRLRYDPLERSREPKEVTLETIVARHLEVTRWVLRQRRYASAMAGVFFAASADARIHEILVQLWRRGSGAWLYEADADRLIVRLTPAQHETLAALLLNTGYANVADWAAGRISDSEFRRRAVANPLLICRGYFRPSVRARADEILAETYRDSEMAPEALPATKRA
jgi:AcrR family transcriptional regulator